jgi:hypothetical protein
MRAREIFEAPLGDFGTLGDQENAGSYTAGDLRAMKSPKWLKKVTANFAKCPQKINVYLYNAPGNRYPHFTNSTASGFEEGRVKDEYIPQLEQTIGARIPPDPNGINFIMLDNEGDEKVGLTPWILVHRFAHAILNGPAARQFTDHAQAVVSLYKPLLPKILTFRSARNNAVVRDGEWVVEMVTQYIIKGRIEIADWQPVSASQIVISNDNKMRRAFKAADISSKIDPATYEDTLSMKDAKVVRFIQMYNEDTAYFTQYERKDDARGRFLKGVPASRKQEYVEFFNTYFDGFRRAYEHLHGISKAEYTRAAQGIKELEKRIDSILDQSVGGYFVVASLTGRRE